MRLKWYGWWTVLAVLHCVAMWCGALQHGAGRSSSCVVPPCCRYDSAIEDYTMAVKCFNRKDYEVTEKYREQGVKVK